MNIRIYHPADFIDLYRICLKTADAGRDASALYNDPDLVGHVYVGPYITHAPDLCFVLEKDGRALGYILGCGDTAAFAAWLEQSWYPLLRIRYPLQGRYTALEQRMVGHIHNGYTLRKELSAYPAHLHIDIVPQGQGQGAGRALMHRFTDTLKNKKVPAVHLEVGKKNQSAIAFYKRLGFHVIKEYAASLALGLKL